MAEKEKKEAHEVKATPVAGHESTRTDIERTRGEIFVTPRADIYETDDALVLVADDGLGEPAQGVRPRGPIPGKQRARQGLGVEP